MPVEIKAWKCEFCDRFERTRDEIVEHETGCVLNPANNACGTCDNFVKGNNVDCEDKCSLGIYLRDRGYPTTRIYCSKHKLRQGKADNAGVNNERIL